MTGASTESSSRESIEIQIPARVPTDPPVPLRVPTAFLTVPGIERDDAAETEIAASAPLERFSLVHGVFQRWYRQVSLQPFIQRWGAALQANSVRCKDTGDLPPTAPATPGDLSAAIRAAAAEAGLVAVGFAPYDPRYTYEDQHDWVKYPNVVCFAVEQDYEATQLIPAEPAEQAVWGHNVELGDKALALGEAIRAMGYHAQIHPPNAATCVIHPYFVQAGLGQMGANGQLLSPWFGSRARLGILTTDAPVTFDAPVDYGITGLCKECRTCIRRCPGRALSQEQVWWRGVRKFKVDLKRCMPMLPRYDACAVCMKVCPVQRYGLPAVYEEYLASGTIKGKGTDDLEGYTLPDQGYFGPGKLPRYRKEDFEVPDGRGEVGDLIASMS